jgi:hypothetical protein
MTITNKISSRGLKFFLLGSGFCFLLVFSSYGQNERGTQDFPKNIDELGQFESPESSSADWKQDNSRANNLKPIDNKALDSNNATRRENSMFRQAGEKDNRKEGMSTLSFNLFLYIVDKFKED